MSRVFSIGSIAVILVAISFVDSRAQRSAEYALAKLNGLGAKERSETMLAEARKEGVVEWYGSLQVADTRDLLDRFKKKYPFIDVRYTRAGGTSVVNRVLNEHKAGMAKVDLIAGRANFHHALMKAGIPAKYLAPFRAELRDGFADKEGYFLGPFTYSFVIGFNTRLVPPDQAPRSYHDLLRPQWKDQLGLDQESFDWLAGMLDLLGEEGGLAFARKMAAQNVRLQRGHTLLTQLMAAGEMKVMIDSYHYQMLSFQEKRAPVDFAVPDPMILKEPSAIWIARTAPHPHATALLVDFFFSRDGQQAYVEQNRLPARKDMEWNFGGKKIQRVHVLSADKWGPRYNDLVKQFDQIFRRSN